MDLYKDDLLKVLAEYFDVKVRDITIQIDSVGVGFAPTLKVTIDEKEREEYKND